MEISPNKLQLSIIDFVAKHTGVPVYRINLQTRLREDLGIDGDDGYELLKDFSARFSVKITDIRINEFFSSEGVWLPTMIVNLLRGRIRVNLRTLTIKDLVVLAQNRHL